MAIASFRAGETISAGNAVYVGASGLLYKANATNTVQASVAGLALDGGTSSSLIRVDTDSVYTQASGLTPGELRYLSITTSGAVVNYATWATEFAARAADAYLVRVGRAVTTSGLAIEIDTPTLVVYT
jgi:hypothetical protein